MPSTRSPSDTRIGPVHHSAAQLRIITAAFDLFARHGVSGTSLQMIADSVGVTKAAVYHQYPTKDEIVIAVAEVDLAKLEDALDVAEAAGSRSEGLDVLLTHVIDLAVERRHMVTTLQGDPVVIRLLAEHEPFRLLMERLYVVMVGDDAEPEARVPAAMMSAAIGGAVSHPLVVELDDDTLRTNLLKLARQMFGLD